MNDIKLEGRIEELGEVWGVCGNLSEGLIKLNNKNASFISAKQLAFIRTKVRRRNSLNTRHSYIREGLLEISPWKRMFVRDSPLLNEEMSLEVVRDNQRSFKSYDYSPIGLSGLINEIFSYHGPISAVSRVKNEITEKYMDLEKSNDSSVLPICLDKLTRHEGYIFSLSIPTNRFNSDELTAWLFQENAENYGLILRERKIENWIVKFSGFSTGPYQGKDESYFIQPLMRENSLNCNFHDLNLGLPENYFRGVVPIVGKQVDRENFIQRLAKIFRRD